MNSRASQNKSGSKGASWAELLAAAVSFHQRGDLAQAERQYSAILESHTDQFDALHFLGVLKLQQGRPQDARSLLRRATEVKPASAEAWLNLANACRALNETQAALTHYQRALSINASSVEAHCNRADVLLDLARYEDAFVGYEHTIALAPHHADALHGKGIALHYLKRFTEALASYDAALALAPEYVDAWNSRGNTLFELKRYREALESYDRALALEPDFVQALNNRGNTLRELKRYEDALNSFERALAIAPAYAEALNNRGNVYYDAGQNFDAISNYDQALALAPDYADALNNRAMTCQNLHRHVQAIEDYERLFKLQSDKHPYTRANLLHSRMYCCDWRQHCDEAAQISAAVHAGSRITSPFIFLGITTSPGDQRECARLWCEDKYPAGEAVWNGERYEHDRIRVAYLSSDFRDHAVAQLTAELFERHDRSRFEVIAIAFGAATGGEMRTRLERAFDRFIDVRQKSDEEVARLLRELEVDIAVDLNGYTMDCRTGILARRGAPVQVNYLGYPGTMAAPYMDYIIADHVVIPEQDQEYYTEKIAYMPDTYLANDATRRISDQTPSRIEAGLPERGFVFCSFNRSYKITPRVFEVWMRLLKQVEGSVLWLSENNAQAMSNLRREAVARGVAPERLVFAGRVEDNADHLSRQRLADLFLDTLPYNAHTTAADALWAGLPVLTCVGTTFAGRVAASVLKAIGLPELITHTLEDYEALALKLAADGQLLSGIRHKLADHRGTHALFDSDRFRRHIEAAYHTMWQRHQHELPPQTFEVEM